MAATRKARRDWLLNVSAFTLAGAGTSVLVGGGLGYLGRALGLAHAGNGGILIAVAVAITAAIRELGWHAIPLPQARRQTAGIWARRLGARTAAVLWGLDLGLFATTWLTFAGAWLIPTLALVAGSPAFGASLFAAYWLGRALSVWLAPTLMTEGSDTTHVLDGLWKSRRATQLVHVAGLAWAVVVLGAMAAITSSI